MPEFHPELKYKTCIALWDTGANFGAVSMKFIQEWGIKPDGFTKIEYGNGQVLLEPYYNMVVRFAGGPKFPFKASPMNSKRIDVLVGMDIINQGAFIIHPTADGGTHFEFSIEE